MRATFEIDAKLVLLLHEIAERRGMTASALVEEAIRVAAGASSPPDPAANRSRPLPSWPMGQPLVDVSNREELDAAMDGPGAAKQLYGSSART